MSEHSAVLAFVAKDAASGPIGGIRGALGHLEGAASSSHGALSSLGGKVADVGKVAAGVAAGGLALLASQVAFGAKGLQDEAAINAQTEAAIRSTGGAAHVSAAQIDEMAQSLKRSTGQSDESIKKTENLLLTFTGIRNEAGKGNDVFNQATQTALDMSVALGQDATSSAMQLGKALNDPIHGMTALQRVGVRFTDGQKAQIKEMVKSGDTMGAQKLILAELKREFGGSAQAFGDSAAGMASKLGNTWEDVQKTVASAVLPVITQAFGTINAILEDPRTQAALTQISGALATAAQAVSETVMPAVTGLADTVMTGLMPAVQTLIPKIVDFGTSIASTVMPAVSSIIGKLTDLMPVAAKVGTTVLDLAKRVWEGGLNKAVAAGAKLIGSVIDVIGGLATAILSNNDVMNTLKTAADLIGTAFSTVADFVGNALDFLGQFGDSIRGNKTAMDLLATIGKAIAGAFGLAGDAIRTVIDVIGQVVTAAQQAADAVAHIPGVSLIGDAAGNAAGAAGNAVGSVGGWLGGLINGKAAGGPVDAMTPYVVGERGPELFVPGVGGTIVPNGGAQVSFGAGSIVVNGAQDPAQLARELALHIKRELTLQGMSFASGY